jgi:hypothetical protein
MVKYWTNDGRNKNLRIANFKARILRKIQSMKRKSIFEKKKHLSRETVVHRKRNYLYETL